MPGFSLRRLDLSRWRSGRGDYRLSQAVKHLSNFNGLSREGVEVGSLYGSDVSSYQHMVLQLGGRIQSET